MSKKHPFLALLFVLTACHTQTRERQTLYGIEVEPIDLYQYSVSRMENLPENVWEEETYILLAPGRAEEMFARAQKIRIQDGKIYILDKRGRNHYLLVYNQDGHPLGRVGNKGNGPGEYIHITDFDIAGDGTICLMDVYMGTVVLHRYDPAFQYIDKTELPFQADLFICLPGGRFLFSLSNWNTGVGQGQRILVTDPEFNTQHLHMHYEDIYDDAY